MILLRSLCLSVALVGLLGAVAAWAEEGLPEGDSEEETATEQEATAGAIDRVHEMVSSGITETADWIDAFFGEERAEEEINRSYLKIGLVRISDEDGMEINSEVRLKVVLPRLQERLQLVIEREGESEAFESEGDVGGVQAPVRDSQTTDGVRSALRLILRATRNLNISLDGGVRVRIPPTVFARLRFRESVELEEWVVRFTQTIQWEEAFEDNPYQWETVSRLDVERPITSNHFFRTSLQGAWFEGEHGYFVSQRFALIHLLSKRRALIYEWNTLARAGQIVETENDTEIVVDPDTRFRIEETGFRLRYRQTVGWPWLFFEFDPEMAFRRDFDRDTGFDGIWRFLVRVEVQFGDILYDKS
ncbi:MAG: hypothetical protein MCM46_07250 [Candidatus Manganitrophus sp. SB1]|nr:hypothetical protein [Candidatus Manganitrophus morganii]